MSRVNKFALLTIGAAIALVGCAIPDAKKDIETSEQAMTARMKEATDRLKPLAGAVERVQHSKIAGKELVIDTEATLPKWFEDPITYVTYSQSLEAVARELSARFGVPVRIAPQLVQRHQNRNAVGGIMPGTNATPLPFQMEWKGGSVKELLDHVAVRLDGYWRLRNGTIEIYETDSQSFHLSLPVGERAMDSTISLGAVSGGGSSGSGSSGSGSSGGSSGGGSGGGASSTVSSSMRINAFNAAVASIKAIVQAGDVRQAPAAGGAPGMPPTATPGAVVGAPGQPGAAGASGQLGTVTGNPELGMVTVSARPPVLEKVSAYVKALNGRFAQNVMIQVRVMSVTVNRNFNAGLSLNTVFSNGQNRFSSTGNLLAPSTGSTPGIFKFARAAGNFTGSELVGSLLSEVGDVSLLRSGQVMAVNGQPAGMQVADEINYVQSSSVTTAANVGTTQALTPGSKMIGFTASFLPTVMDGSRILLQYTLNLSTMISLDQVSAGTQMIQLPKVSTQSLQQQAYVNDGETLVLFGFEENRNAATDSTSLMSLSGNRAKSRQMLVIVMDVTRIKES